MSTSSTRRVLPIRGRGRFESVRCHGQRVRGRCLSLTMLAADRFDTPGCPGTPLASPRVSYAIGSAVGGAVVRNRLRRQLRSVIATASLRPGAYLVAARPCATAMTFSELGLELTGLIARVQSQEPR